MRRALLYCGVAGPLLYIAMNLFVPTQFPGYDWVSQTVSELSAISAPTRPLWIALAITYGLLMAAFGWGIWSSAGGQRSLAAVGALLIVNSVVGFFWPPMHLRGEAFTLTDTLHIVFTAIVVPLMIAQIGLASFAFGERFKVYSAVTLVVLIAAGIMTGIESPNIAANLPTPYIGIWERVNIGAYIIWSIVLAAAVLRRSEERSELRLPRTARYSLPRW